MLQKLIDWFSKKQYINIADLPPHTLLCECGTCTIKPKHYAKHALKDRQS